ncbi:hypothetical protein [Natronorubrum daqingense]|uniref:Uncharacterized protein n=1 Tax=Natronorubrum daqingense TaxID=588898 RepID=A0A1N7FZR3_9EURY|nr:hypothetical protein [Natronorubrum daqingense]APX98593.1 hypothetical protein BB347_18000 [Natronorubrum daqingense]SIS05787.1 hypothetical protein SAMN05421809_3612 [Natronorubrum daqingense]
MSVDTAREWAFEEDDVIREEHEQFAPGGVELGKSEYRIKRRLIDDSDGDRFYHVEKEEGGTHLYSAGAIEHSYEVIDAAESRGWSE